MEETVMNILKVPGEEFWGGGGTDAARVEKEITPMMVMQQTAAEEYLARVGGGDGQWLEPGTKKELTYPKYDVDMTFLDKRIEARELGLAPPKSDSPEDMMEYETRRARQKENFRMRLPWGASSYWDSKSWNI
jgi:hypothetical protein